MLAKRVCPGARFPYFWFSHLRRRKSELVFSMASISSARDETRTKSTDAPPQKSRVALIFLAIALILGGAVRLYSLAQMPFAFGDGGMFWVATRAIADANFALPPTLAYPAPTSALPFCYPPLGFYAAALLNKIGVPLELVFRWLPWTWSMATIWAFWRLARTFWRNQPNGEWAAGAATLCWALLPWSFFWMVMGGGLTRALGLGCAFLAIDAALKLWRDGQTKQWLWLTIWLALTMASHLERARFAVVAVGLVWLFYGLSARGAWQLAGAGLGAAVLSSPWWGLCLLRFGLAPFAAAARSGGSGWSESSGIGALLNSILFTINGEAILPFAHILGALGLIWCVWRRQWFLPVWTLIILLVEVRSGRNFIIAPLALSAGILLAQAPRARVVVMGLLTCWLCFLSIAVQSKLVGLTPTDLAAMNWAAQNTPADARFLVVPQQSWELDMRGEWFPALANRAGVLTAQGAEWLPNNQFTVLRDRHRAVYQRRDSWKKIETWTKRNNVPFDWIWFSSKSRVEPDAPWKKRWSRGDDSIWQRVK